MNTFYDYQGLKYDDRDIRDIAAESVGLSFADKHVTVYARGNELHTIPHTLNMCEDGQELFTMPRLIAVTASIDEVEYHIRDELKKLGANVLPFDDIYDLHDQKDVGYGTECSCGVHTRKQD